MENCITAEEFIGRRISMIREAQGYTQAQMAEIIGFPLEHLCAIENGNVFATLDELILILNLLECRADDIFMDVLTCSQRLRFSYLAERLEALPPLEQEKAFCILDILTGAVD